MVRLGIASPAAGHQRSTVACRRTFSVNLERLKLVKEISYIEIKQRNTGTTKGVGEGDVRTGPEAEVEGVEDEEVLDGEGSAVEEVNPFEIPLNLGDRVPNALHHLLYPYKPNSRQSQAASTVTIDSVKRKKKKKKRKQRGMKNLRGLR